MRAKRRRTGKAAPRLGQAEPQPQRNRNRATYSGDAGALYEARVDGLALSPSSPCAQLQFTKDRRERAVVLDHQLQLPVALLALDQEAAIGAG